MPLNLLGKRKWSDIESDEYATLSYSVLCCNRCRNRLIVRRYPNGTYAAISSVEPHCEQCKHYVDCREEHCPVCCLPESGEPVPSFSDLVTDGVMCVKILNLPVSISAEPGSSSADDGAAAAMDGAAAAIGGAAAGGDSVSAAGGAGPVSFVANSSTLAIISKNFNQAWSERIQLQNRITTVERALKPRIADQQEQIHKLVQGIGAARVCAVDLDTRLKAVETAAGASATDFDARLKKLEAGPGYTRESIKKIQAEYVVNAPMTEEERASWDQQPLILRFFQWRVNYNNECILKRITKLEKQALATDQPAAAGSAVVAAGASVVDLDTRLKKLEAGTGHTREEIRKIKAGYDVTKDLTDEEFTQLASTALILQKTHWRFHANIQASWNRISGVKKETAELKQALATEQQATAELKQALAAEQQATASQAQEIAALKQTLATQGQAVQGMDANIAQMMQAVQAMMGPMHGELVELRRRVAMLEAARPAGFCMAVKKESV